MTSRPRVILTTEGSLLTESQLQGIKLTRGPVWRALTITSGFPHYTGLAIKISWKYLVKICDLSSSGRPFILFKLESTYYLHNIAPTSEHLAISVAKNPQEKWELPIVHNKIAHNILIEELRKWEIKRRETISSLFSKNNSIHIA